MKTLLSMTVLIVGAFAAPGLASADEPAACSDGYVAVESAGGPICVAPTYVNNPMYVDPSTCTNGYYQGNCVPDTLPAPVVHPDSEYAYQPVAQTVAPVTVARRPVCDPATNLCVCRPEFGCTPCRPELGCSRLSAVELALGNLRAAR